MNRNGTLVPNSGDRYDGMVRAGDGVPESELIRVPNGNSPAVLAVPAGAPRGFYGTQHLFAPRFSFAWTPTGDADTAVRGGIGLFYDRPEGNLLFGGANNGPVNNPPYTASSQYENGNISAPGGGTNSFSGADALVGGANGSTGSIRRSVERSVSDLMRISVRTS